MTTFPTAISDSELDYLATIDYKSQTYLLVWQNTIVMKARVNQASFGKSFATITYDTITEGAYADALEGYVVYLSHTDDIQANYTKIPLRMRGNATSTQLLVEETAIVITDNDYIFVVKDVRPSIKVPRIASNVIYMDYDIVYQTPPAVIGSIQTAYLGIITDESGYYDLAITPSATAIASGATISSWALTLDGGTQQSFNASTGAATIRYTVPGNYMPRFTVTDSNSKTKWFTPHVFIALKNDIDNGQVGKIVNLTTLGGNISYTTEGGISATVPIFDGIQNVLDGTFAAIYSEGYPDVGGNKILFTGIINNDVSTSEYDPEHALIKSTNVELLGIGPQMQTMGNIEFGYENKASPTTWQQLKDATLWRVVGTYLTFLTNINNIYSISFSDISNDYQWPIWKVQSSDLLSALTNFMNANNSFFDWHPSGELRMVRHACYLPTADRTNLTTVANWDKEHWQSQGEGGFLWELQHSHNYAVSRMRVGVGWYNTSNDAITSKIIIVPSGTFAGSQAKLDFDSQVMKCNQTAANSKIEAKQRAKNAFAFSQQLDTLPMDIGDVFVGKLIPSVAAWHTHTITVKDNIKGDAYTTSTRWLLTEMSVNIDTVNMRLLSSVVFIKETDDLGYDVIIKNPETGTPATNPTLPPPAMSNLPVNPGNMLPTGGATGDSAIPNSPPINPNDVPDVQPIDPVAASTILRGVTGFNAVVWTTDSVYLNSTFGYADNTNWVNTNIPLTSGHTLKMFQFDRFSGGKSGAYAISNNGDLDSPETTIYTCRDVPRYAAWKAVTLDDILATQLNVCNTNVAIIYGKAQTFSPVGGSPLKLLYRPDYSGPATNSGQGDTTGSSLISPHSGSRNVAGVYNAGSDWYDGQLVSGGNYGIACNVEWPIPAGVTITRVRLVLQYDPDFGGTPHPNGNGGEDTMEISYKSGGVLTSIYTYDGVLPGETISLDTGTISVTGTHLLFHCSVKTLGAAAYARIIGIKIYYTAEAEYAITRHTEDFSVTWEDYEVVGKMDLGDGSMTRRVGQEVLAAKNELIKSAALVGLPYSANADQGSTAGEYAVALLKFDVTQDYHLATETKLYRILDNVRTDITPNSGGTGIIVGIGGLAMRNSSKSDVWFLGTFGGTMKLAYTNNALAGTPSWSFNTNVTADAKWVFAKPNSTTGNIQVAVADGTVIKYSVDGGVTLVTRSGPGDMLEGVEIL